MSAPAPPPRYTKATLPTKPCARCGRPMTWRKKWAKTWADVRYCSERCRRTRAEVMAPVAELSP